MTQRPDGMGLRLLREKHPTVPAELVEGFRQVLLKAVAQKGWARIEAFLAVFDYQPTHQREHFEPLGDLSDPSHKDAPKDAGHSAQAPRYLPEKGAMSRMSSAGCRVSTQPITRRSPTTCARSANSKRRSFRSTVLLILPPATKDDLLRLRRNVPKELLDLPIWVAVSRAAKFHKSRGCRNAEDPRSTQPPARTPSRTILRRGHRSSLRQEQR